MLTFNVTYFRAKNDRNSRMKYTNTIVVVIIVYYTVKSTRTEAKEWRESSTEHEGGVGSVGNRVFTTNKQSSVQTILQRQIRLFVNLTFALQGTRLILIEWQAR